MMQRRINFDQMSQTRCTGRNRRGAILIIALVCIVVISVILASLLKLAAANRRQMRNEERRLQAVWLVESAVERAATRLKTDPDFAGEEWQVPADQLGGRFSGLVTITVQKSKANPAQRLVSVEARYPANTKLFIKISKKMTLQLPISAKE